MNKLEIGSYVQYQGRWYLACALNGAMVQIVAPGHNAKLMVSARKLKVSKHVAKYVVGKDNRGYLITRKSGDVLSTTSNRWVSRTWFDLQVRP